MWVLTGIVAVALYAGFALMVAGTIRRILMYARTPAPLKIPTTPAPTTRLGVIGRMTREVMLFESLFKATKWTWLFGWTFHVALLLVLAGHLRYFTEPAIAGAAALQTAGKFAALAMLAGLAGLWMRRILVDRVRYISAPSDHLMLALLVAIAITGVLMRFAAHPDIIALKAFTLGLVSFNWQPLPSDPLLVLHLLLVAGLMAIFPFSKLLHAPGVFFSPTRNQADNPRERRHVTRWAERAGTGSEND